MSRPDFYICTQSFAATLEAGDAWFKAGERVRADHKVFDGESGKNRQRALFRPADELVGAEK